VLTGEAAPVTLGHEFSGTVEELGEGVSGLSIGDRVVVEPYFVCDECGPCREGHYNLCTKTGFIGLAGGGGGLSEKVVVDARWVHPVGDIPLDEAALIEPLAVAYHAVGRSGVEAGDVAVVGGAGPIGLLTVAVLKGLGVTTIVTALSAARKDKAVSSGVADHLLDPSSDDVRARVLELTEELGADAAFECAGVNAVLDTMLDVVLKEIDLRGTIAYCGDHEAAIRLVQEGKVDLKPFITGRIPLEDLVDKGFDTLINHNDTAVKIIVQP
jgi:(R,R)-butanediol dehydrogenase/meso-butanediol dehydrogenase/diacetyl reductase